jgi:hypothetical protein
MILTRCAPVLARCVVGAVVTTDRFSSRDGVSRPGGSAVRSRPPCRHGPTSPRQLGRFLRAGVWQGVRGQAHDWAIRAAPWGVRPEDIHVPVDLYDGGLDDCAPLRHARDLAARLPFWGSQRIPELGTPDPPNPAAVFKLHSRTDSPPSEDTVQPDQISPADGCLVKQRTTMISAVGILARDSLA